MNKLRLGSQSSLYPYPATIISTEVEGGKNFMQLGFVGIVNANPGMVAMGVGRHHHSIKGLNVGDVFALAIANEKMMLKADYVGIRPGDKYDKSKVFETEKGDHGANIIVEAPINLEVKIIQKLDLGGLDYTIIAEILEVYAEEEVMSGKNPDIEKINPIMLSMYENRYFKVGEPIGKAWRDGLEYEKLNKFVVNEIFPAFDELRDNEYFKPFVDNESKFMFDDKEYVGYEAFCQWLDGMRDTLKSDGLSHVVEKFDAQKLGENNFRVSFTVNTKGEMKDGSSFEIKVLEDWKLRVENDNYVFVSYDTKVIG